MVTFWLHIDACLLPSLKMTYSYVKMPFGLNQEISLFMTKQTIYADKKLGKLFCLSKVQSTIRCILDLSRIYLDISFPFHKDKEGGLVKVTYLTLPC